MGIRYISEQASAELINHKLAFEAVREAFIQSVGEGECFPVVIGNGSAPGSRFTVKSATGTGYTGVKVGSYWPDNVKVGIPCHGTSILLLDAETGMPAALIEAAKVNAYRTAAADAVAVSVLAREDAKVLTVFGTGHQAEYECLAVAEVRDLEKINVVGRDKAKAVALADKLKAAGLNAVPAEPEAAVAEADIIVTATTATAPLFNAEWVRPGTHVSSMGSDGPGKQELPVALFAAAGLFCDLPEQSVSVGEFQHLEGQGDAERVVAIGDVLTGRNVGRISPEQITVFDSSGIALQDLAVAEAILKAAG